MLWNGHQIKVHTFYGSLEKGNVKAKMEFLMWATLVLGEKKPNNVSAVIVLLLAVIMYKPW